MALYRIHIRPQGGTASVDTTFKYCRNNGILGVGWRVKNLENTTDWNLYYEKAKAHYNNLNQCKYIKKYIKKDDLVWTRDRQGNYYLAKVNLGWEYFTTNESNQQDIDIANIFRVDFAKIPTDVVSGKVIACFRASRTMQEISGRENLEYAKYLWNKFSNNQYYDVDFGKFTNIFTMLDDKETEDIVFLYLQDLGWYVVPNSRESDTISFEYFLVNKITKEKARVQVKTGKTTLNQQNYTKFDEKIFLFQSNDLYKGINTDNVVAIRSSDILDFMKNSLDWLPSNFKTKFDMISLGKS